MQGKDNSKQLNNEMTTSKTPTLLESVSTLVQLLKETKVSNVQQNTIWWFNTHRSQIQSENGEAKLQYLWHQCCQNFQVNIPNGGQRSRTYSEMKHSWRLRVRLMIYAWNREQFILHIQLLRAEVRSTNVGYLENDRCYDYGLHRQHVNPLRNLCWQKIEPKRPKSPAIPSFLTRIILKWILFFTSFKNIPVNQYKYRTTTLGGTGQSYRTTRQDQ